MLGGQYVNGKQIAFTIETIVARDRILDMPANRLLVARITMTAVMVSTTIATFVLDWSPNHLLNPLWHPHAKFHGALLLFMLAGMSATSCWMMWRKSSEGEVAVGVSALLALSFWTPLFYITSRLPGSTSWAGAAAKDPRLTGSLVTPNLAVAALFILLSVAGCWLSRGTGEADWV